MGVPTTFGSDCRTKQRSLVITLLDLKNAFGEVHHNLIPAVLSYNRIPEEIQNLIHSLYSNFYTSIVTDTYQTPFLKVGRGVLQGDFLSPLTFNLALIHSFTIFHIKNSINLAFLPLSNSPVSIRRQCCCHNWS